MRKQWWENENQQMGVTTAFVFSHDSLDSSFSSIHETSCPDTLNSYLFLTSESIVLKAHRSHMQKQSLLWMLLLREGLKLFVLSSWKVFKTEVRGSTLDVRSNSI
ncbi:hypothetical protein ATANTOWER_028847 [Ataeniobius toweri]|uniref:Uncharacterized protein n=1 Tax=Ataeniobius toweri TaxID=208326 RepID=A0ABU7ARJ2_9TELE|nr:hypothetical protein [Ataeniobius toweri]